MFYLCVFLSFYFLSAEGVDTSITISHFQYQFTDWIPVHIDETGGNTYFLNNQNPGYLIDYQINVLQLDGSLGIPLGSYFLPDILPNIQDEDSIYNHSQIYYRKGDYDYNDLGIGLLVESADRGIFSYQGFKRSPPRLYQPRSSELQNHLMRYKRSMDSSMVEVDVLYHIENYKIPMDEYNNRQVESFHSAMEYEYKLNKIFINFQPSFQFTYIKNTKFNAEEYSTIETNHITLWNNLKSTFRLWSHFNLLFRHSYKMRINENEGHLSEGSVHIILPGLEYDNDRLSVMSGIASSNAALIPVGKMRYGWKHYYLSVERKFEITFIPTSYDHLETAENTVYLLIAGCHQEQFTGNVEVFKYDGASGWGVKGEGNLQIPWLSMNQQAGLYNIDEIKKPQIVDMYSLTKMIFSPNIWIWREGRFQPFIGMESVYIQYAGLQVIDPLDPIIFSELASETPTFSSQLLNVEFGFLFKGFKVSYCWINLINEEVNNTANAHPIAPIRHLEVVWQFLN